MMATRLRFPAATRANGNGSATPRAGSAYPVRRRWRLAVIGVPLLLGSAWAAAVLYAEAGDRHRVVGVARPAAVKSCRPHSR